MYCARCGRPVEGRFCRNCGEPATDEIRPQADAVPFREMVGGAWRLYRSHFRLFAGCAAMVTVLQALELLYVPWAVVPLVFLTLWPIIVGVVSQAIAETGAGRTPPSVQSVYEAIGRWRFLKLAAANLLLVLAIVVGLCLLILPGVYLWVRFQFVPQILVRRNVGVIAAFGESAALVRGRWWRVFGIILAMYGVAAVVNLAAVLALMLAATGLSWPDSAGTVAVIVGMSALWTLMDPLFFGVLLLLYVDLQRMSGSPIATFAAAARRPGI